MAKKSRLANPRTKISCPADIEQLLSEEGALGDLESLVNLGCDREHLLLILFLIVNPPYTDSKEAVFRATPRKLQRVIRQIRNCAEAIEETFSGWHLLLQFPSNMRRPFSHLPETLRLYAWYIEHLVKSAGPKKHPILDAGKYVLVEHVNARANRPCDREVSGLLACVLGNLNYDALRQGRWRREYTRQLQKAIESPASTQKAE